MIGRPWSRSSATPWEFIETSIAPEARPSASRPTVVSAGEGASSGRASSAAHAGAAARTTLALPARAIAWPATNVPRIAPHATPRITSPSVPLERSKRSWMNGICAIQAPTTAPLTTNIAVVEARADTPGNLAAARRAAVADGRAAPGRRDSDRLGRGHLVLDPADLLHPRADDPALTRSRAGATTATERGSPARTAGR